MARKPVGVVHPSLTHSMSPSPPSLPPSLCPSSSQRLSKAQKHGWPSILYTSPERCCTYRRVGTTSSGLETTEDLATKDGTAQRTPPPITHPCARPQKPAQRIRSFQSLRLSSILILLKS